MLLFVSLTGFVAAVALAAVGTGVLLGRGGKPLPGRPWRGLALLAAAGALAVYVCGLGPVGLDALDAGGGGTDSAPPQPCRTGPRERWMHVEDWGVGFVPVRFECRLAGGGSYRNATVPGWVNPAAVALGLVAAASGIAAGAMNERAAHRTPAEARTR
ncbi:hypothetical protein [Kitasatospora sp. DSM 101779]|uniref:hypothetical protein n=1 Tax=Kitasatospora sp. DSM 101779 TaxID=2853165 RepID=UPI0021D9A30B|nr:hypothetical protein [Kitasatospora sp. DSM 101779]MCU7826320.1 hypothetical protein [Kitasatospora sp. DSM 101779]